MKQSNPHLHTIPYSPFGVIDTVKLVLQQPLEPSDLEVLSDFRSESRSHSRGDEQPSETRTWVHQQAGARVHASCGRVSVEASLPRVIGYPSSYFSYMLSERQVLTAIADLTVNLLPKTTERAAECGEGWVLQRLDLAVNCKASIVEVVEAYRLAQHPEIRSPATAYGQRGLAWYGARRQLVIYDPFYKLSRSVAGKGMVKKYGRGRGGSPADAGVFVRVEARFKGKAKLSALGSVLPDSTDNGALPFPDGQGDGAVLHVHPDHATLRRVVAKDLAGLGCGVVHSVSGGRGLRPLRQLGLAYLVEHPEHLAELEGELSSPSVRKVRKELTGLSVLRRSVNLLDLGWGAHLLPEELLRRLHEERASWIETDNLGRRFPRL